MTNTQLKILSKLKKETYLKRIVIEKSLPLSKRTLVLNLKQLIDKNRVESIGQLRGTQYKLSNKYYEKFEHILYIYQNQTLIGYLGFDFDKYYFAYDTEYILNTKHDVRFEMPLSLNTYIQESCFVDFEECLPEGIDKKILIEKTQNAAEFFLLEHNDYSSNDLIISPKELSFNKTIKKYSYQQNKNKILGKNKFPNILPLNIELDDKTLFPEQYLDDEDKLKQIRTMSLSGYQHKLQVILKDNTLRVPNNDENVLYFIKPYSKEKADPNSDYYFPHIAINEHLHLTFAKNELGFDVPYSAIFKSKEDSEYHFLIKYFDRINQYKFQRKEFATYMGLNSSNKYKTSSEKLFEISSKVLLRESDRLRMLEYYFYSFIIRHEDMHTKNISCIYDDNKTFIAPLYDIATTGFYNGINNYESHLTINGKQTNIRFKDFMILVKKANVNKNYFIEKANFIIQTYINTMPKYIKKISKLENTDFYKKEKPNAQNKKIKIKEKTTLEDIMLNAYNTRIETLKKNGWLNI